MQGLDSRIDVVKPQISRKSQLEFWLSVHCYFDLREELWIHVRCVTLKLEI